jgi:glyoxylase-like metal-dependent hydrolase (beta-lactamase superfamily II)
VQRLIVTHYHPDHIGLAAWLCQRFGLTPWMALAEFLAAHAAANNTPGYSKEASLHLFHQHGLTAEQRSVMAARGNVYQKFVPELPTTFRRIQEGDEIAINRRIWRVITGYGHAPEHCALYCAELNVLISGDMVLPRISTNVSVGSAEPDGDPLHLFLTSLERYLDLPADTLVLPSHGKVFRGLHTRIAQLRTHHEERLALLVTACRTPQTAMRVLPVLFNRELDSHQIYFALGEAVAHLNYLMHQGRVHRALDADGVYHFVSRAAAT